MDHVNIVTSHETTVTSSSTYPVVLNGADTLGLLRHDSDESDKTDLSVSLSPSLIQDAAVLVGTPRGYMLSVSDGVGNVSLGNISDATDEHGNQLLPLPGTITLFTPVQQDALVDTSSVFDTSTHQVVDSLTGKVEVAAVTTVVRPPAVEETKKRRGGWPKGKKRKQTLDVKAPRAPLTGYVLYAIERRQEIKGSNPEITFSDVTKILGQEWSTMSPDKKQKYLQEASAEKERYIYELKTFQQSDTYQNFLKKKRLKAQCDAPHMEQGEHYASLIDVEDDSASELYCRVCNQYFSSIHNKKEHMFGRQHLQAITGELEKEMEQQQQQQQQQNQTLISTSLSCDLHTDALASMSDSEVNDLSHRLSVPMDIASFIHKFAIKNTEREHEIKMLRRILQQSQAKHVNMCKEVQTLKDYEIKLEQNIKTMKSYAMAIATQINGLKMVPTLFGVINF